MIWADKKILYKRSKKWAPQTNGDRTPTLEVPWRFTLFILPLKTLPRASPPCIFLTLTMSPLLTKIYYSPSAPAFSNMASRSFLLLMCSISSPLLFFTVLSLFSPQCCGDCSCSWCLLFDLTISFCIFNSGHCSWRSAQAWFPLTFYTVTHMVFKMKISDVTEALFSTDIYCFQTHIYKVLHAHEKTKKNKQIR